MEEINIKKHPPWYARGTPVTNNRDGPAMVLSDTPLIVIRRKSSASGEGKGEGRGEGRGRGKSRCWLTLKTFFSTRKTTCLAIGMRRWKKS